ncbi:MAG: hypothetical protein K9K62_10155 [Desulfobacteraceae bacterium]|nr:hypothetical protein [Desulfobacteraceae bacterium]
MKITILYDNDALDSRMAPYWGFAALIGGLHGFSDFPAISSLDLVCATHCTRNKDEIRSRFPDTAIAGGAGKIIGI